MADIESVLGLIDGLKSEDHNLRLHAINNVHLIAGAIGPERTREELVPYLTELLGDDNDEVLLALAVKLGDLAQLVGCDIDIGVLLPPLQTLARNEEAVIRDKAVESINRLAQLMPVSRLTTDLSAVIKALCESEWFSARISAAYLLYIPLSRCLDESLLTCLFGLAKDDTPMVRRAAAANLGNILSVCKASPQYSDLIALYDLFFKDDHDSVRQMALQGSEHYTADPDNITRVVKACVKDSAWRIRYSLVEYLANRGGQIEDFAKFIPDLLSLQGDSEAEVRSVMLYKMPQFATFLGKSQFVSKLLPGFTSLTKDPSPYVRLSLVTAISEISGFLGGEDTAVQLVPLISLLIKDESFEVRLAFAESLQALVQNLGADRVFSLLCPTFISLMNDTQWRIRVKVAELLPQIASLLGKERFEDRLLHELPVWIDDPVHSIREAMFDAVVELASIFGNSWASGLTFPLLKSFSTHTVFTKRMTALLGIQKLAGVLGIRKAVDLLLKMAIDSVPNIRFCVAKAFKALDSLLEGEVRAQVKRTLEGMTSDNDFDVRYYAELSLRELNSPS